jgi:hypothetical protein
VRIYSQWLFTQAESPLAIFDPTAVPPVPTFPNGPDPIPTTLLNSFNMYGNGFFITRHIIVCPAHLVLAPPNYTLAYNQWPFSHDNVDRANFQDVMAAPNRIMVDVLDVNGTKHSYTYQASLLGVSGVGDVAVLFIDMSLPWNANIPCIMECHPHFRFGCSRKYKCGEVVYALGDPFTRALPYTNNWCTPLNKTAGGDAFVQGTIADNRYLDYPGFAQPELVAVNMDIFDRRTGLPLIDKFGHVIAMQTMTQTGAVTGSDFSTSFNEGHNGNHYVPPNGDGVLHAPHHQDPALPNQIV